MTTNRALPSTFQTLALKHSEAHPRAFILTTLSKALQRHLNRCYLLCAPPLSASRALSSKADAAVSVFCSILFFLNLVSLAILTPETADNNFSAVWAVFIYSRLDCYASISGMSLSLTSSIVGAVIVPLISLLALIWIEVPISRKWLIEGCLVLPGKVLAEGALIPATYQVLYAAFRLVGGGVERVGTDIQQSDSIGVEGALGLAVYPGLLAVAGWTRLYSGDVRWPRSRSALFVLTDTTLRVTEVAIVQGLVALSLLRPLLSRHAYVSMNTVLVSYQLYSYLSSFPYYIFTMNLLFAGQYIVYLYFIFIQDAGVSQEFMLYSLLFLVPAFVVLVLMAAGGVRHYFASGKAGNILKFDLKLRSLCEKDKPERHSKVKSLFCDAKRGSNAIVRIWECLYYYYYQQAPVVGLIRLNREKIEGLNWSLQFLVERIQQQLTPEEQTSCQYIRYKSDWQNALDLDCETCLSLQDLMTGLVQQADQSLLSRICLSLKEKTDAARFAIRNLMVKYKRDAEVGLLHDRFMKEVMGRERKSAQRRRWTATTDKSDLTHDFTNHRQSQSLSLPLLIVSKGSGVVLFTTNRCSSLFGQPIEELPLSMLLPELFNQEIYKELREAFLETTEGFEFIHENAYFRLPHTGKGLCIGVKVSIVPMDRSVYYEIILTAPKPKKDFAILNETGEILLESCNFLSQLQDSGLCISPDAPMILSVMPQLRGMRRGSFTLSNEGGQIQITTEVLAQGLRVVACPSLEMSSGSIGKRSKLRFALLSNLIESEDRAVRMKPVTMTATTFTDSQFAGFTLPYSIYKAMKRSVARSTSRVCQVQLISTILLIAIVYVLIFSYFDVFKRLDTVAIINDMGRRRFRTANIVNLARQIQMTSAGTLPAIGMAGLKSTMKDQVDDFTVIVGHLRDVFETWPRDMHRDIYTQNYVPIWEQHSGLISVRKTNLFEAMSNILIHATAVLNLTNVPASHPSFLYLYRNGLGETMQYLNLTTYLYSVSQIEFTSAEVWTLSLALLLGVHIMLGLSLVISMAFLLRIEKIRMSNWRRLTNASKVFLTHRWTEICDRLETLHGFDERSPFPERDRPLSSNRHFPGYCLAAVILMIYVGCTSGFTVGIAMKTNGFIYTELQSKAPYMNWSGMRRMLSTYNFIWLRELFIDRSGQAGYYDLNPEGQLWPNLYQKLSNSTQTYALAERHLTLGGLNSLINHVLDSPSYSALMFSDPCQLVNITNCQHSIVAKGLHYALNIYLQDLLSVAELTIQNKTVLADVTKVVKRGSDIGLGFVTAADIYDKDSTIDLHQKSDLLLLYPAFYFLAVGMFYLLALRPGLNRYRRMVVGTIQGCKIVLA